MSEHFNGSTLLSSFGRRQKIQNGNGHISENRQIRFLYRQMSYIFIFFHCSIASPRMIVLWLHLIINELSERFESMFHELSVHFGFDK